jgi:hypothetical protein
MRAHINSVLGVSLLPGKTCCKIYHKCPPVGDAWPRRQKDLSCLSRPSVLIPCCSKTPPIFPKRHPFVLFSPSFHYQNVLVPFVLLNRAPETVQFMKNKDVFLTVLEAGSPRWGVLHLSRAFVSHHSPAGTEGQKVWERERERERES